MPENLLIYTELFLFKTFPSVTNKITLGQRSTRTLGCSEENGLSPTKHDATKRKCIQAIEVQCKQLYKPTCSGEMTTGAECPK